MSIHITKKDVHNFDLEFVRVVFAILRNRCQYRQT